VARGPQLSDERRQRRADQGQNGGIRALVYQHLDQGMDPAHPLGRHQAELGQMAAQGVHQHGALADQERAYAMQHQDALLLFALHRNEAHVRPPHRLANRLRIAGLGLPARRT
jgi:hypothetical protein